MSSAWDVDEIQEIDVAAGKARDFEVSLALEDVALGVADIADLWFTVKADEDDTDAAALIQKRLGAGINVLGAEDDAVIALVSLTTADTAVLTAGKTYFFDVQVKTPARGPDQAAYGYLVCGRAITLGNS